MNSELLDLMPPQDIAAERGVLGSLLLDPRRCGDVAPVVRPEDFYADAHQKLYACIQDLADHRQGIDTTTLTAALKARGEWEAVGGAACLAEVIHAAPVSAHAVYYARIVADHSKRRRAIHAAAEILRQAYAVDSPLDEVIRAAEQELAAIQTGDFQGEPVPADQAVKTALQRIEAVQDRREEVGILTGLRTFDQEIGGLFRGELFVLAARPGVGKCLGKGTPVLLCNGETKRVENLRVGDALLGPDSEPRHVLSTAHGTGALYRVVPTKGDSYVVNEDHVLSLVVNKNTSGYQRGQIVNLSVRDYLKMPTRFRHAAKAWRVAIQLPQQEVPLDPYFVGLWLGDGTLRKPSITTPDAEIVEALYAVAQFYGLDVRVEGQLGNQANTYTLTSRQHGGPMKNRNPVWAAIRAMKLNEGKHVPDVYKYNCSDVRLGVLAGILDTDGHFEHGCYDYISGERQLAEDVVWLARSLGFAAYVRSCVKGIKATGFEGQYWRVCISGNVDRIPLRVKRKIAPPRRQIKNVQRVGFAVTPIGQGEYFGFELDGDGLFLLGDFTVTHNTALACQVATHVAQRGRPVYFVSLEMSATELVTRLLCSAAGVSTRKIRTASITPDDGAALVDAGKTLSQAKLYLHERPAMAAGDIRRSAQRLAKTGLSLVVVDYMQRVTPEDRRVNRYEQVAQIAKGLKTLARELNMPVLCLCQSAREADDDKSSKLRFLRESGDIETEADVVAFLVRNVEWRERPFRRLDNGKYASDRSPDDSKGRLELAKNRNGPIGVFELKWFAERTTFQCRDEWEEAEGIGRPQQHSEFEQFSGRDRAAGF